MANREELQIIRNARAGQSAAQLSLGKRYLSGGAGLPKSLPTALYWLDRAARQDEQDAWLLIGSQVPFETAQQAPRPMDLCIWYERAYDAGVAKAGLVLAKLVLAQAPVAIGESMRAKALRALHTAAQAGIAEAQWLLAQHVQPRAGPTQKEIFPEPAQHGDNGVMLEWATRAARSGVREARYAMADHAWAMGDHADFVRWALPLARELASMGKEPDAGGQSLLTRCAQAMIAAGNDDVFEAVALWECAARAGDRKARLCLGLWYARMDSDGGRMHGVRGTANYKKAIRWLSLAAEQGAADAMYALSRIYRKPECSQRNASDAGHYLEKAAEAGHAHAQLELGIHAWRTRRVHDANDVRAASWLQKASACEGAGSDEARTRLHRIAACAHPARWAVDVLPRLARAAASNHPLLVARVELAALFGLSRAEALLLDPKAADCGHCLQIDIRRWRRHSKRHLILVQSAGERQALDRIVRLFDCVDCGPDGPEGSYRRRLYRLRTLTCD